MPALSFMKEIEPIEVEPRLREFEDETSNESCGDHKFCFGDAYKIVENVNRLIGEADWDHINTWVLWTESYKHKILYAMPFYCDERGIIGTDLCPTEEDFLNVLTKHHIRAEVVDDVAKMVFKNNSRSPLYRWFLSHRDGAGGNISVSIRIAMNVLWDEIYKEMIELEEETYSGEYLGEMGKWLYSTYCYTCRDYVWGSDKYCPFCGKCSDGANGDIYYGVPSFTLEEMKYLIEKRLSVALECMSVADDGSYIKNPYYDEDDFLYSLTPTLIPSEAQSVMLSAPRVVLSQVVYLEGMMDSVWIAGAVKAAVEQVLRDYARQLIEDYSMAYGKKYLHQGSYTTYLPGTRDWQDLETFLGVKR